MSSSTIQLILWIPFTIAIITNCLIYAIEGYKKGLHRAIISFASTIVACIISIILSKVVAPLITKNFFESIASDATLTDVLPINFISMLLESFVQTLVALILFFLFLIIFATICRITMGHFLMQKKDTQEMPSENEEEKSSKRWAALGIGFANAFLLSLLLLLPLYGTIATYIPSATKIYTLSTEASKDDVSAQDELLETFGSISRHPIVQISGKGPMAGIYKLLSKAKTDNVSINYSKMADTLSSILTEVEAIKTVKDRTQSIEHTKNLLEIISDDVITEEWAYKLVLESKDSLETYVPGLSQEQYTIITKALNTACTSEESFRETGMQIIDNISAALEDNQLQKNEEKVLMEMFTDILENAEKK